MHSVWFYSNIFFFWPPPCPHQLQEGHEKVAEQISRDVSQLCSQLAALWSRFLEAAVLNPHILSYLAQEHHTLRVRVTLRQARLHNTQTSTFTVCSLSHSPDSLHIRVQWRQFVQICLNLTIFILSTHTKIKILQNNPNGFITSDILVPWGMLWPIFLKVLWNIK